ncbi:DUF2000 domain-containing protein [Sporolactobacillus shoreae]|uniref:DUF2000 domain-containing protein n=1 Tax=Sporolactobacillus shoreae TaxID=1465501 RepID=A0A4Z0GHN9_9BACL|nr:DUF2000 domain-containing protein [Sporolactobacillus shoreae]TGA96296.1 DUF2000 domain-containing protein [Sporolactobacillus shoreae]
MKPNTKIVVVIRDNLQTWQELNVTAFTVSGIAGTIKDIVGQNYEDGSGNVYLPMFKQPVLVFSADQGQIQKVHQRALSRAIQLSLYTEELFDTNNDEDNRAAVKACKGENLQIVGMAMYGPKNTVDKILKGLSLHK